MWIRVARTDILPDSHLVEYMSSNQMVQTHFDKDPTDGKKKNPNVILLSSSSPTDTSSNRGNSQTGQALDWWHTNGSSQGWCEDGWIHATRLYHRISFCSQTPLRMGSFYQIHSNLQRSFRCLKVGLRIAFSFIWTWRCALSQRHLHPLPPTTAERLLLPLHCGPHSENTAQGEDPNSASSPRLMCN